MSEIGRLFAGSDTWLAVIDCNGAVVRTSAGTGENVRLEELFSAATVEHLRELLPAAVRNAGHEVEVIRGHAADDADIELRVVRSNSDDDFCLALVRPAAEAGADRARSRVRELSAAIQAVADIIIPVGELEGHEEARRRAALVSSLTDRERRVALAVADGIRTSQIANDLFVSQSTVRNYLPIIYRKLGVRSRGALIELLNAAD